MQPAEGQHAPRAEAIVVAVVTVAGGGGEGGRVTSLERLALRTPISVPFFVFRKFVMKSGVRGRENPFRSEDDASVS